MVWVADLLKRRTFYAPAESQLRQRDIYTLRSILGKTGGGAIDPFLIEHWWEGIEGPLGAAIDAVEAEELRAETWLRTLVPFVASVLGR
jgi:hypothetical protein